MWKNKIITQAKFQIVYADFKFYLYFMVSEIYPGLEAKLQNKRLHIYKKIQDLYG